jgi:beta-alanine degradation protein BauB
MATQDVAVFGIRLVVGDENVSKITVVTDSACPLGCECVNGSNWDDDMSHKALFLASVLAGVSPFDPKFHRLRKKCDHQECRVGTTHVIQHADGFLAGSFDPVIGKVAMSRFQFYPIVVLLGMTLSMCPVLGADVPDALSVEWQGKKPCELLHEDSQIRIMRCTLPPGAVHVRHSHPASFNYVLSGGKVQLQDEKGTRAAEVPTGAHVDSPPVPWHEATNVGDTTLQFLVIEEKYQPLPTASQGTTR